MKRLIDTAALKTGKLDVLVNNAGIAVGPMPVHEMSEEQMHRQIAVKPDLDAVRLQVRAAAHAPAQAGVDHQLRVDASARRRGGWTAYAGTKGAAIAMTQQLAVEFAPFGIRVNCISPGAINTPMNAKIVAEQGEQLLQIWNHMHPLGRIGEPSEIASAAVFWLRTPPRSSPAWTSRSMAA